jgi:hypothetical protein
VKLVEIRARFYGSYIPVPQVEQEKRGATLQEKQKKIWIYVPIPEHMPYARTKFQRFTSNPPLSPFKKLIVSTPRLLRCLYPMSLAKAVPDGLKDRECKKTTSRKRPPISYVPEKDCVQETVSAYKDNHLKTQIGKGMELRVPIWHSGTHEAFLIHVGLAREAIEKKGYFKAYEENNEVYVELRGKIKSAKAQLATLEESAIGEAGTSKKSKKT